MFRDQFDSFPDGEVDSECGSPDQSPDITVNCDSGGIGMEHARLYRPDEGKSTPFQDGESIRKRVADQLRGRLESSPIPPVLAE